MKFERFMFLALIASLVLSMGLVVACGDDDDDDDDDTADDDTGDDDTGDDDCEAALGDNVEACFEGLDAATVCAQDDADCWVACFQSGSVETCEDWLDCLVSDCGYSA